mgnify:CR=1 FL=1
MRCGLLLLKRLCAASLRARVCGDYWRTDCLSDSTSDGLSYTEPDSIPDTEPDGIPYSYPHELPHCPPLR